MTGPNGNSLDELRHFGKKGMKWGVRNDGSISVSKSTQRGLDRAETKFQSQRSAANAKVVKDRSAGVTNPKNQGRAAELNSQHKKNQEFLKSQGFSVYKKPSADKTKPTGREIRDARLNQRDRAQEIRKTGRRTEEGKKLTRDLLMHPDRVTAARLTRGEKVVSAIVFTPVGTAAFIGAASLGRRNIGRDVLRRQGVAS